MGSLARDGWTVAVLFTAAGAALSVVETDSKPGAPVQVDYVVLRTADGFRVVDIVTEGSSITKNYYDQFDRMLSTPAQGYAYMVMKLEAKIASR